MDIGRVALLSAIALVALAYIVHWWWVERARREDPARARTPRFSDLVVGFVTNFFDTLGIGCFAPTTAYFKLRGRMPDDEIPGTLNTGQALPAVTEALIFIATVSVDLTTLVSMILAAVLGAWLGVGFVARLSRRAIQFGMGGALMCAALLYLASNLNWIHGSGDAPGLHGLLLIVAVGINMLLGALMMLGVGLYAPCLILVSLLGMNPLAAFPITVCRNHASWPPIMKHGALPHANRGSMYCALPGPSMALITPAAPCFSTSRAATPCSPAPNSDGSGRTRTMAILPLRSRPGMGRSRAAVAPTTP